MKKTHYLAQAGVIAALYTVLTLLTNLFGLASGVVQVRISEALCILPCFTPAAIPGLFIGCIVSNIITGGVVWDVIFGSLATLIGAVITRKLSDNRILACIPPIAANTIIVPFVLRYAYGVDSAFWYMFLTVFAGEFISCGILGQLLYTAVEKRNLFQRDTKTDK